MKYIDRIMSYEDYRDFRDIYESLSEYCHPNSASRTLDFHSSHVDHRKYLLVFREGIPLSIGFFNVFSLVLSVLPRCCDRLDQDLELIDGCRMPMSPLNEKEMATVQPIGRVAARDMFTARVFWTKPSQILAPTFSPAKLTARQTQRAQTVAHAFSEVVDRSEDEWLALFSTNMDIEGELQISEKMVTVYEAELNERPRSTLEERKWLFATVNDGVTCSDVGQLLSIRPELKSLPNLDRTFQRLRKWFSPVPPCESD